MSKNKIIIGCLVSAVAIAVIAKNYSKKGSESPVVSTESSSKIEASALVAKYNQDKAKFLESFKDKEIEVFGVVRGVAQDPNGEHKVFLGSNGNPEVLANAVVKEESAKVSEPSVIGQDAILKCSKIISNEPSLALAGCKVIELKANPVNASSAQPSATTQDANNPAQAGAQPVNADNAPANPQASSNQPVAQPNTAQQPVNPPVAQPASANNPAPVTQPATPQPVTKK